jgi:hypothetical protein
MVMHGNTATISRLYCDLSHIGDQLAFLFGFPPVLKLRRRIHDLDFMVL